MNELESFIGFFFFFLLRYYPYYSCNLSACNCSLLILVMLPYLILKATAYQSIGSGMHIITEDKASCNTAYKTVFVMYSVNYFGTSTRNAPYKAMGTGIFHLARDHLSALMSYSSTSTRFLSLLQPGKRNSFCWK